MKTWGWSFLALLVAAGCIRFPPDLRYALRVEPQESLLADGRYYFDSEDSTTVFEQTGFRLKLRYLSDQALNQEYARFTFREPNLNPFTYGADRDLDRGYAPPRFTVFELTVVNQSYPKVMVDPAKMVLRTDRGGEYAYWGVLKRDADNSFERYYMERRGKGGNEDYYYQERMGLVREALFRRHTFVFKGDAYTGKVVFAPLHAEVLAITVEVEDMVLRVDAFDRPKEVTSASFAFAVTHEVAPVLPVEETHNVRAGGGQQDEGGREHRLEDAGS